MDDLLFYISASLAVLLTGISKSGFGGIAMLAVPLMSVSVSPFFAAGVTLPILILMDAMSAVGHWKKWSWEHLKLLLPWSMVGVLVGAMTAEYATADMARILVGSLSLMFVAWANRPKQTGAAPMTFGRTAGRILGGVAGYTSFVAHAGGPPLQAYLLTQKLTKAQFTATGVLFFGIVNIVKTPAFLATNLITSETLFWSAVFAPLAPIGVWLGLKLNRWLDPDIFFRIIHVLLVILGIKLMYEGLTGLFV